MIKFVYYVWQWKERGQYGDQSVLRAVVTSRSEARKNCSKLRGRAYVTRQSITDIRENCFAT